MSLEPNLQLIEQGIISMLDEDTSKIPTELTKIPLTEPTDTIQTEPTPQSEMLIQYMSDLHLEFYDESTIIEVLNHIVPIASICVLAGDIGYPFDTTYELFIRGISEKFEHVFLIHGNHEYYQCGSNKGKTRKEILLKTLEIVDRIESRNVHFLNNSHYDIGEYRFVGSVLWSEIRDPRYLSNDYSKVYRFSLKEMNRMHYHNQSYISSAINQSIIDGKKIVMISHHVPSYKLNHPKYKNKSEYFQCFSSHSDFLIVHPVVCWIFGHTHSIMEKYINNVYCAANPIGYPGENMNLTFDKCIRIVY